MESEANYSAFYERYLRVLLKYYWRAIQWSKHITRMVGNREEYLHLIDYAQEKVEFQRLRVLDWMKGGIIEVHPSHILLPEFGLRWPRRR